jgi:hypothetical protein
MQSLLFYTNFNESDTPDTKHELDTSVLTMLGLESPPGALYTGLYGASSSRKAFPFLDALFREQGHRCCAVTVDFDFDVYPLRYTGIKERTNSDDILISESKVLNTLRLRPDLKTEIKAQWKTRMIEAGAPVKPELPQPITQIELVDSLLVDYPNVELFIYQIMSPVGPLSVGSIYNKQPLSLNPWFDIEGSVAFKQS